MWWAIETLTTVGYGDMVPATAAGKLLGGLVSIVGIGTLALFSGVITVGFLDQLKHRREHHVPAETLAGEHSILDRHLSRAGRSVNKLEAMEASGHVCPHCGYRLISNVVEAK
jgi:voltage-gated potassium channel